MFIVIKKLFSKIKVYKLDLYYFFLSNSLQYA
jgi:hypothetical protein